MAVDKEAVKQEIYNQLAVDEWAKEQMLLESKQCGEEMPEEVPVRSNRGLLWDIFAGEVFSHVEEYAVAQYKDFPDDPYTTYTENQLKDILKKYVARMDTSTRGELDKARDLMKIAHLASCIWVKRLGFEDVLLEVRKEAEAVTSEEKETTNE